jgi:transposase
MPADTLRGVTQSIFKRATYRPTRASTWSSAEPTTSESDAAINLSARYERSARDPKAFADLFAWNGLRYRRVGIEAWGGLAFWIYNWLSRAGFPIICIEARQAHAVL